MTHTWHLHPDGGFDLEAGPIRLVNCYPAFDGVSIRAISVEVDPGAGTIVYRLRDGRLTLRLGRTGDVLTLGGELRTNGPTPWWIQPLAGEVRGATRFFRQGLGFAGPSGFVDFTQPPIVPPLRTEAGTAPAWTLQSYMVSALQDRPAGATLSIAAVDHRDYLQKTTLHDVQHRRGLINRWLETDTPVLHVGFGVENTRPADGIVRLPELQFRLGADAWQPMHAAARAIGQEMGARTNHDPRYHYCSWYYKGPNYSRQDLNELLAGLKGIRPPVPIQAIQIDDNYETHPGDWLEPNHLWPGGMKSAFDAIRAAGYAPGIWVAPFMVGSESRLFREHPDWVVHGHDGKPHVHWRKYGQGAEPETYELDASHPEAQQYIGHVFRTLRSWGATMFKTDFMEWGLRDSTRTRRHRTDRTSVQVFRDVLGIIREAIGEESYWLACIAPFAPFLGFADGMRVANDTPAKWAAGSQGNMFSETFAGQYFNNVLWQNDPDVLYVRTHWTELSEVEVRTCAYWQTILGTSVNTSDPFHLLPPDRLALWRFLRPSGEPATARLPYWSNPRKLLVAVREYGDLGSAVLVVNPTDETVWDELPLQELIGRDTAYAFRWGPGRADPLGEVTTLQPRLAPHHSELVFLSQDGTAPPPDLTLGGRRR